MILVNVYLFLTRLSFLIIVPLCFVVVVCTCLRFSSMPAARTREPLPLLGCRSAVIEHGKFKPSGPGKEGRREWTLEMKFFHSRRYLCGWVLWRRASRITRVMFVHERASGGRARGQGGCWGHGRMILDKFRPSYDHFCA